MGKTSLDCEICSEPAHWRIVRQDRDLLVPGSQTLVLCAWHAKQLFRDERPLFNPAIRVWEQKSLEVMNY